MSEAEECEKRKVVTRGISGKIKWFNIPRGYGFIERLDEEPDVFGNINYDVISVIMTSFIQFTSRQLSVRVENRDSVYYSKEARKSNLMLSKVMTHNRQPYYVIIMYLGLKGLEAAAVTGPDGYELATVGVRQNKPPSLVSLSVIYSMTSL